MATNQRASDCEGCRAPADPDFSAGVPASRLVYLLLHAAPVPLVSVQGAFAVAMPHDPAAVGVGAGRAAAEVEQ